MTSRDAAAQSLPGIPKAKQGLVRSPRGFDDSGVDLSRAGSAGTTRSPPNLLARSSPLPLSPRPPSPARRSLGEYVRVSRGELERKDQSLGLLRSENIQLQAKVRELESVRESHSTLLAVCVTLGQTLSCSLEGVAADSVGDILTSRLTKLQQELENGLHQVGNTRSELDRVKGELAVANVRVSTLESHLQRSKSSLTSKEERLQQIRDELDNLQQSKARMSSTLQSLRQQLTEYEDRKRRNQEDPLTDLQTEIGRMRSDMREKEEVMRNMEDELAASRAEQEVVQERADNAETAYSDLCSQLVSALQLQAADSVDAENLINQVCSLVQESSEMKLRLETTAKTIKTAELDSKANKETIAKLVSQVKMREKESYQLTQLQQTQEELQQVVADVEGERDALQERLVVAKETLAAQNQELQAKEARLAELVPSLNDLRQAVESERAAFQSQQRKFEEFSCEVGSLLGCDSQDTDDLLQSLEHHIQRAAGHERRYQSCLSQLEGLEGEQRRTQACLRETESTLEDERSKVRQLEGEVVTLDLVKEGLCREVEKYKSFLKQCSKALQLDIATAEVISGEFAADAILTRAEQLARQETHALAEKQSTVYCLQRRLKASRQKLDSKEIHIGLLQKKIVSLEDRLSSYSNRESDWEGAASKTRKLEKQLERVQKCVTQQNEALSRLQAENTELDRLKHYCTAQEERLGHMTAAIEELEQTKVQQSRELAETKQRTKASVSQEREELERVQGELRVAQSKLESAKEREKQLRVLKSAVQRLLGEEGEEEDPADYDLIARLERLVAFHKHHSNTVKMVEHSLRQLESGFRTGYTDALTLLNSET